MLNRPQHGERGSSLVSVLVTMLVLTLFATLVAVLVTNTTRTLVGTRATTQSRQAADAGLAASLAAFRRTTDCSQANLTSGPTGADPQAPQYGVECTIDGDVVTITSTGSASGSAKSVVEAKYRFEVAEIEGDVDHMTFFGSATFTYETDSLSGEGDLLSITIAKGDFTCQNTVEADLVIAGNFAGNGSAEKPCVVKGDVWAGGTVKSNLHDVIQGEVVSASTSGTSAFNGTAKRDFTAAGNVELTWDSTEQRIGGDLTASGNVAMRYARVADDVRVPSSKLLTASWQTTVDLPAGTHSQVGGQIVRPTSITPPAAPPSLEWRDYNFAQGDWTGYAYRKLTSAQCNYFNSSYIKDHPGEVAADEGWQGLATFTSPTIIDATGCASGLSSNWGGVTASAGVNLVFVAKSFDLTTLTLSAAAGTTPKAWFIVPDTIDNNEPTGNCWSGGTINLNHVEITVQTFLYTPGCINVAGGGVLHGTMYSGGFIYGGEIDMHGVRVPFPGGGDAGGGAGGADGGLIMTKISQRDIS